MQKKKNVPAFLRSTYEMLEREDLSEIVSWAETGNGFVIKNLERFSQQILPQYFKHKKYTSFVRQLNMYGFHKQRHHLNNYNYFAHQHFRKGNLQSNVSDSKLLLAAIKRKPQKKKKASEGGLSQPNQESQPHPLTQEMESSSVEVSMVLENERSKEDRLLKDRSSSHQNEKEQWSSDSPQFVDEMTEKVMEQNQLLRNLHERIRSEVINSKKRTLQKLSSNNPTAILLQQKASISQLAVLLIEGINLAKQITQSTI